MPTLAVLQTTPTPGIPAPQWDVAPSEADADIPRLQALGISDFLHDQMDYPDVTGATGVSSQNFESARDMYDSQAADDFELPYYTLAWNTGTVEVDGFYVGGGERVADSVNL